MLYLGTHSSLTMLRSGKVSDLYGVFVQHLKSSKHLSYTLVSLIFVNPQYND